MEPLIPRELLFGNPERASPSVAPDGRRLAFIAPEEGVLNVWVGDLDGERFEPVTHDRGRGVRFFHWAEDGRHLLYVQDAGGDENWRLYAVEPGRGEPRDLTPFPGVQARVLGVDRRRPHELVVGLNRDDPTSHDPYLLRLADGELRKLASNPGDLEPWIVDPDLQLRGAVRQLDDGGAEVLVGDGGDVSAGRPLLRVSAEDALTTAPIGLDGAGRRLHLLTAHGAEATRLCSLDLATGTLEELAADPRYDVDDVVVDPATHAVQIVSFMRERRDLRVLDTGLEDDVRRMSELGRGDLVLGSRDHADRTWVVALHSDDAPTAYHAYDRSARRGRFLFSSDSRFEGRRLARMEPFSLRARDGLELHGYLTFPPDGGREGLPTVLNVHGGPWARDVWGFGRDVQWLANRGYLCLQVNFRGSTGYGKAHLNAGDREWGRRMHDDLIDTVRWAVERGYADADRVGIFGGSYGGYAALVGAAFTPDVFRCAVDVVGPSNLQTLLRTVPPYWKPLLAQFHHRVGHPELDADLLWERSPLSRAESIRIPLLIAQGANDPRVKRAESEQIVAALRERGIEHEYLVFEDEGHGFVRPENRLRFYAAAERFLARHLGGRCEP
jgi:dipeptidyl aminopeptidase/acylaminoacyl peptidase